MTLVDVPESSDIAPWAMQLVARVEKTAPPDVRDIARAAARATIGVLSHPEAEPGGLWHDDIDSWCGGGRIRKIVRRARGADWERAQEPAGVTAVAGTAMVRAYVPSPVNAVPKPVARMQIRSDALELPKRLASRPLVDPGTMVIALTPEIDMTWGKSAAQVAHGAQRLWEQASHANRQEWHRHREPIEVVLADAALWNELEAVALISIRDAGFTEVAPNTETVRALWQT